MWLLSAIRKPDKLYLQKGSWHKMKGVQLRHASPVKQKKITLKLQKVSFT